MRIVCVADSHGRHEKLYIPPCDLLISAGDYSMNGERQAVKAFHEWLADQPAKQVVSVQGNHELWVEKNFREAKEIAEYACPRVRFIEEGHVDIDGMNIWASSITPEFGRWAYMRSPWQISKHWDLIPNNLDILITHGPPFMVLDQTPDMRNVGCPSLSKRILEAKPKHHVFGHIHGHGGRTKYYGRIACHNASVCNEQYEIANLPIIFEMAR